MSGGARARIDKRARPAEKTNVKTPGRIATSARRFSNAVKDASLATVRSLFVTSVYVKEDRLPPLKPVA
jgi:hypothetical protein